MANKTVQTEMTLNVVVKASPLGPTSSDVKAAIESLRNKLCSVYSIQAEVVSEHEEIVETAIS